MVWNRLVLGIGENRGGGVKTEWEGDRLAPESGQIGYQRQEGH